MHSCYAHLLFVDLIDYFCMVQFQDSVQRFQHFYHLSGGMFKNWLTEIRDLVCPHYTSIREHHAEEI